MAKLPIVVFISGGGTNLQSIIDHVEAGLIEADIRAVMSNQPDAYGLERARAHGLRTIVVPHREFPDRHAHEDAVQRDLAPLEPELLVLAGYMRLVTPEFIRHFYNSKKNLPGIINIHPALLPSFPGTDGYGQAFAYGVKYSGITVHFVDEGEDTGPVILQDLLVRKADDTVETFRARGLEIEHRLLPQAIQLYARNKLELRGRYVYLKP